MHKTSAPFYVTGGTLRVDAPSYVERRADLDLYHCLSQGLFSYVLTARQMGKSSLMTRVAARLRAEGVAVAVLDLTTIGQNLTVDQWYDGLLERIGEQLGLNDALRRCQEADSTRTAPQRWLACLREVVLPLVNAEAQRTGLVDETPVVVFLDEIDTVRSLPFPTDPFFGSIRDCYNRRGRERDFNRLTFCLLGVATREELVQDPAMAPFVVGRRIELTDFTETEAAPLAAGLGRDERRGRELLKRVLYWTGGHPYLTQRFCQALAENPRVNGTWGVDRLCNDLFLSPRARQGDVNLLYVRDQVLRSEVDLRGLLELYANLGGDPGVPDDDTAPLVGALRLTGLTRPSEGYLLVRNRIYARVFDQRWVREQLAAIPG